MNCTTYRIELENIVLNVFKLINTHPSSMSRQKNMENSVRRYKETQFYRQSTSRPKDDRPGKRPTDQPETLRTSFRSVFQVDSTCKF